MSHSSKGALQWLMGTASTEQSKEGKHGASKEDKHGVKQRRQARSKAKE